MRRIGQVDDEGLAGRLEDVLFAHGIRVDVRPDEPGSVVLWVHDDARIDEARSLMEDFLLDPKAPRFAEEEALGRKARAAEHAKDVAYQRRAALARQSVHGADGRGWLTMALLAISAIVALVSQLGADMTVVGRLMWSAEPFARGFPELQRGEVWRLITPIFVHFGVIHLLFNGSMWWSFGQLVELRKGFGFTLGLVVSGALFSNGAEAVWGVMEGGGYHYFGGLSGVLYGMFGYAWTKGRIDPIDRIGVPDQTRNILLGWLVLCMTGALGPVANAAHTGGLVWGIAYAYADKAWFQFRKGRP